MKRKTLATILVAVAIVSLFIFLYVQSHPPLEDKKSNLSTRSLTISEWAITMDQPSQTTGLLYGLDSTDANGVQRAHFGYEGLEAIDGSCSPKNANLGTLARFRPQSTITLNTGEVMTVSQIEANPAVSSILDRYTKAGENYYYLETTGFKSICGDSDASKNFFTNNVYTEGFMSLSDPAIQASIATY